MLYDSYPLIIIIIINKLCKYWKNLKLSNTSEVEIFFIVENSNWERPMKEL